MTVAAGPAETTGLTSAQAYATQMMTAYTTTAEQTRIIADALAGHGVTGPAVAAIEHAHELTVQAGSAWGQVSAALQRQTAVSEAYAVSPEAGSKAFLTDGRAATSSGPSPAGDTARSSGRPPQQPDAVGALWVDPDDGYEAVGRIVKRTKSSADIEWPNGRVQRHVPFSDPQLRWLTAEEVAAEATVAERWPDKVRGVDGMVAYEADDENVTLTAGTTQQVAGIDPEAWRNSDAKERYAVFGRDGELPKLTRALGAASRAATAGKPYRKTIDGDDIGDVELTVVPQPQAAPTITMTVRPYTDVGDREDLAEQLKDLAQERDTDLADIPHETEDDDHPERMRPLTDDERAAWAAGIQADYQTAHDECRRENPDPQPLVVTLTVPMAGRLREQLAG